MTRCNRTGGGWTLAVLAAGLVGCQNGPPIEPAPPLMLGASIDELNRVQEENAEAAKYVIYQHEFEPNFVKEANQYDGWRLNEDGEDHVKQIAANLLRGDDLPVVVERSRTSVDPRTNYLYPVHLNEDLDEKRRRVIVASLSALGVQDADSRVVVAPAFSEGLTSGEAAAAYQRSTYSGSRGGGMGMGGYGGGVGVGGGFF